MSQEPPNSQPPLSPEPGGEQSKTKAEKVTQTPQSTPTRAPAAWKAQLIRVLRGIIQLSEGAVEKLEEPSTPAQPSLLNRLQAGWSAILARIRSLLPENLSDKLSDSGLTGIIAVSVLIVVGITSVIGRGQTTEVTPVPPTTQEQPPTVTTLPLEPKPPAEPGTPADSVSVPPIKPKPPTRKTTPPELVAPPELTAPQEPIPVTITPPPEPVLTPEQNLIAAIENQVAEVTDRYADGLIRAIQVDFSGSRLAIKVSDDWYTFDQSQQDNLAARMFERARQLDFSRLEVTDAQGTLVARSPVVGNSMVILQRRLIKSG